jgi:hypothetical protein
MSMPCDYGHCDVKRCSVATKCCESAKPITSELFPEGRPEGEIDRFSLKLIGYY